MRQSWTARARSASPDNTVLRAGPDWTAGEIPAPRATPGCEGMSAAAEPARRGVAASLADVRPGWVVACTVFVSAGLWWLLGRGSTPWIFPDELIYSELAKSIAAGGLPTIRETTSLAYGLGYPLLLAPAWALTTDPVSAHSFAKVTNALLLESTALPAFLLARRFVAPRLALAVAVLSVLVPSMAYGSRRSSSPVSSSTTRSVRCIRSAIACLTPNATSSSARRRPGMRSTAARRSERSTCAHGAPPRWRAR